MLGNAISSQNMKSLTEKGNNVVMDRMFPSTIAYLKGKDLDYIIPIDDFPWPPVV